MVSEQDPQPQTNRTSPRQSIDKTPRRRPPPTTNGSSDTGPRLSNVKPSDDARGDPEIEDLENEIKNLRDTEQKLQEEFQRLEEATSEMKQKLDKRREDRVQLEKVTKRLTIAQKFLSTADNTSQGDVVQAIEALNEEIFQLTSIVADKIQVEEKIAPQEKQVQTFGDRLAPFLKREFVMEVVAPKQLEDTLAVQIGWQAILVRWCSDVIRRWALAENEEVNQELERIYRDVAARSKKSTVDDRSNEHSQTSLDGQAVAGRWRTLAHRALHNASPTNSDVLVEFVVKALVALPILCGYVRSKEEDADLCEAFRPRIRSLLEKCLNFRKMAGEGLTSVDIEPQFCESGEQYDSKRADLEYDDDNSAEKQGTIACTVCLGLDALRRPKDDDGKIIESRETMLKPKVILQNTLIEIIS